MNLAANIVLIAFVSPLVSTAATPARANVPTGLRASAARAEAEAFAALEERRDCDAARAFLYANELAEDERLVVNAALALERFGARGEALALLEKVRGTPAGLVADADARVAALALAVSTDGGGAVCLASGRATRATPATRAVVAGANAKAGAPVASSPFLPAGVAAIASGLVVAGSTAGAWVWLDQGVINSAQSSGDAKLAAIAARDPVLIAGGSLASALVVAGAVLVPLSLSQSPSDELHEAEQ